jgi:hypothetical protein
LLRIRDTRDLESIEGIIMIGNNLMGSTAAGIVLCTHNFVKTVTTPVPSQEINFAEIWFYWTSTAESLAQIA